MRVRELTEGTSIMHLLLDFVTEVTVTEVTIFVIFTVVLLQIVVFSFTDLHDVLAALSQVHIHL